MINAIMVAGEPFEVEFQITISDQPEDITAYAANIELRDKSPSGKLLGSWSDSSPELTRDNANGKVVLLITASQTNTFSFRDAYMDLLLLNTAYGRRSAALEIELDRGVTR